LGQYDPSNLDFRGAFLECGDSSPLSLPARILNFPRIERPARLFVSRQELNSSGDRRWRRVFRHFSHTSAAPSSRSDALSYVLLSHSYDTAYPLRSLSQCHKNVVARTWHDTPLGLYCG